MAPLRGSFISDSLFSLKSGDEFLTTQQPFFWGLCDAGLKKASGVPIDKLATERATIEIVPAINGKPVYFSVRGYPTDLADVPCVAEMSSGGTCSIPSRDNYLSLVGGRAKFLKVSNSPTKDFLDRASWKFTKVED